MSASVVPEGVCRACRGARGPAATVLDLGAVPPADLFPAPDDPGPDPLFGLSMWWTYSAAKAKRELGYASRPHEETLQDAVAWQAAQLGPAVGGDAGLIERGFDATGKVARLAGRLLP